PASIATASPGPTPAAASPPATLRARWWTSSQEWRTGEWGSPVLNPLVLRWALANIVSVKRLIDSPLWRWRARARGLRTWPAAVPRGGRSGRSPREFGRCHREVVDSSGPVRMVLGPGGARDARC